MNINNKIFIIVIFLLINITQVEAMEFFNKELSQEEFESKILKGETKTVLQDFSINGFSFSFGVVRDVVFKNTKWSNINGNGRVFKDVSFYDCELSNINFRSMKFTNVDFHNCVLKNVIMNDSSFKNISFYNSKLVGTDSNIDNSYLRLNVDKLMFKDSELNNISFYQSKAVFEFYNSKLNDVSGQSLKAGSALYFNNSTAFDVDFSRSDLYVLEIINSNIKSSKINNSKINRIDLVDSILDFPIANGIKYGTVKSINTGNIIIGGTPVDKTYIKKCPENTRLLMVGGDKFDQIVIEDCSPDEIIFYKSDGEYISITNATVYKLDFRLSKIKRLRLENVHIKSELLYDKSNIENLELKNIIFDDDIEISSSGSNISIQSDGHFVK